MPKLKKTKISDRVTKCSGVISFKGYDDYDLELIKLKLYDVLNDYEAVLQFYYILHNETDTPHIHFVLLFHKQQALLRILNYLSENLKVDIQAITVDKLINLSSMLRYFLHIDKESKTLGKHVYDINQIISNQVKELIQSYLDSNDGEISTQILINYVIDTNYEYEIMELLGIKLYHKYRYEIKALREEQGKLRENRRIEREKELPF